MQFIADGPDIPNGLLQLHEEGRLIFFCGAGISYPAGLPNFQGLVKAVYRNLGTDRTPFPNEQLAYKQKQFDTTLHLLEQRVSGGRLAVRKALERALQPNISRSATKTHEALLTLARNRGGELRLVTTNFDRVFHAATKKIGQSFIEHAAPLLPIPKDSRWNSLVFLHGLLPETEDDSALQNLVLTSGDFGLAYLTERWAARFVSELFRNHVVCFVGYSINDPILRYVMDALAADRMRGENSSKAYAFVASKKEWKGKDIIPIFYTVRENHALLHDTLTKWAATYRDGSLGKEQIVIRHAHAHPLKSTQQDDFLGRMLWALSDKTGRPAKRFAEYDPAPSLEWLYASAPHMGLLDSRSGGEWDRVMEHLACWLTRHLNDPELILWLAQRGSRLHDEFSSKIEQALNHIAELEQNDPDNKLARIRDNAPNAIPDSRMRALWRLFLTGRVKSPANSGYELYQWLARLQRDGLTTSLRLELRKLLAPMITLRKPFISSSPEREEANPPRIRDLVDWELVLSSDYRVLLDSTVNNGWAPCLASCLPVLLPEFQQLLSDALDLCREMGEADEYRDRSSWDMPSISAHQQNHRVHAWVVLIELLRDAWLAVEQSDSVYATRLACNWFNLPYPTFKRLALFAASRGAVASDKWADWLLVDNARWLWALDTKRETMRLFVLQGATLAPETRSKLEATILDGPLLTQCNFDSKPDWWDDYVTRAVWLRLVKMTHNETLLSSDLRSRLQHIPDGYNYSDWQAARADESNEFSLWIGASREADFKDNQQGGVNLAELDVAGLVQWLEQYPEPDRRLPAWSQECKQDPDKSFSALAALADKNVWPARRWEDAFNVWSQEEDSGGIWPSFLQRVPSFPDDVFKEIALSMTRWLKLVAKTINGNIQDFFNLCKRVLNTQHEPPAISSTYLTNSLNHPIGDVTQALLNLWFSRNPNDNDGLPVDIEPFFTQLCDTTIKQFRYGRLILSIQLVALFRVDRNWTEQNIFPLLDWERCPEEAAASWEGFLWSPRLYPTLMGAIENSFLQTAYYYEKLSEPIKKQYADFITYVALDQSVNITKQKYKKYRNAFAVLPQHGLEHAAKTLVNALEGASENPEIYWEERIYPFWHNVWPKSQDKISERITGSIACLCIAASNKFPEALIKLQDWLQPIKFYRVIGMLQEKGMDKKFPEQSLEFLSKIIDNRNRFPRGLNECLTAIVQKSPELAQDIRYRQLLEIVGSHA
jgi:hypothetical protein